MGVDSTRTLQKAPEAVVTNVATRCSGTAQRALFERYLLALSLIAEPASTRERLSWPATIRLAGLTSVADWIGSSLEFGGDASDAERYYSDACVRAEAKLDSIGWHSRVALHESPTFQALFPRIAEPRPLQRQVDELVCLANGPTLLLIEAPMGEGKTEAALLAHCALQARNQHRGLYFALPTQATGNAMFKRLTEFLEGLGHTRPIDVQLAHGLAALNPDFARIRGIELDGVDDDSDALHVRSASLQAAGWFTARRRALLSEYGVGTVDQALIGVLPAKHHFVRLFGLANRVVVIDEVHAYDSYTSGLIVDLLRWLKALDSSAIVMTATLPQATRNAMLEAWGAEPVTMPDYPRIAMVDATGMRASISFAKQTGSRSATPVRIERIPADIEAIVVKARMLTDAGGCALVLANTVGRAQDIFRALRERECGDRQLMLFHSRFPAGQRSRIEQELIAKFGPKSLARPFAAIVVATQVVEQSMDVDFDVLITDLAPIDLVLQRIGRMHRHERSRPSHLGFPTVFVAGLDAYPDLPPLAEHHWDRVYDRYILLASAVALASGSEICLPDDIDVLVQRVYTHADRDLAWPVGWESDVATSRGKSEAKREAQEIGATNAVIGDPLDPRAHANWQILRSDEDDDGDLHAHAVAQTRLGLPSLRVLPMFDTPGGLSLRCGGEPLAETSAVSDQQLRELIEHTVPISNPRMVAALRFSRCPDWLDAIPVLRQVRVLKLNEQGASNIGGIEVALDSDLGLVIASAKPVSK